MNILLMLISLSASIAGSISGIGGGVLIKPILDATGLLTISAISFLSGSTVLSMATVNVLKSLKSETRIDWRRSGFLAIGAVVGGISGNHVFNIAKQTFSNESRIGIIQSVLLLAITVGVLLFTIYKSKIHAHNIQNAVVCFGIGWVLGLLSSFLGIGGGPINIAAISFFLGMNSKETALNSLFVVFCSQLSSLLMTITQNRVPAVNPVALALMIIGGIGGGLIGSRISKKRTNKQVDRFFIVLLLLIGVVNIYNIFRFAMNS